jgi:hypothetical protein
METGTNINPGRGMAMEPGDRLYSRVEKIVHDRSLNLEDKLNRMRSLFTENLPDYPQELIDELFDGLLAGEVGSEEELRERSEVLPSLTELLVGEFDDRRDPFSKAQWKSIGEIVSSFGMELDERTLGYIMTKVVDRKAL